MREERGSRGPSDNEPDYIRGWHTARADSGTLRTCLERCTEAPPSISFRLIIIYHGEFRLRLGASSVYIPRF